MGRFAPACFTQMKPFLPRFGLILQPEDRTEGKRKGVLIAVKKMTAFFVSLALCLSVTAGTALAAEPSAAGGTGDSGLTADLTARTSSRKLYVSGVPMVGLVEIGGKFYIPGEVLEDDYYSSGASFSESDDAYRLSFESRYFQGEITTLTYWSEPPAGQVIGTAALSAKPLLYKGTAISGAVYTLGGRYPMISLDALGATSDGTHFYLDAGADPANYTLAPENDITGGRVTLLIRSTARETVTAIHDYLVNTLTYDPFVSAPYGTTEAAYAAAESAYAKAGEQYSLSNNITLIAQYGVCQNYAELFRTMCIRAGIPCIIVTGMGNGGSHAWNMVYVENQWLYVDCTWDDPVSSTPTLRHDYLLIGADQLVKDHYWVGSDYPMPAEYDPAWEQLDCSNITSADMFRKCLVAQMMQHKTSITLRTTASGAYGGVACICAYPIGWETFYGGYNSAAGTYQYTVAYW